MLELEKIKCEFCEKKMEWIPCSKLMPEEQTGRILVNLKGGEIETGYYSEHSGFWCLGNMSAICEQERVIAWMPLPEPYEE